jgi:monofunctional biosynthetic peptidoglycan transglycosylase
MPTRTRAAVVPLPCGVRRIRALARIFLLAAAVLYGLATLGLVWLRWLPPLVTMVQLQRLGEAAIGPEPLRFRRERVALASLPRHVSRAVVAAEDSRFFTHHGFDWTEVRHAIGEAQGGGRRRGASTLTQQLVKNLYFTTHRSPIRKAGEALLTPMAELILPKQRILELYLNEVEWASGVYGIEAAARHHYRRSARRLTREQSARLAAVLPAPRRRKPARMGGYASIILARMRAMGW